jgi:hypothetical protein
MGQTLGKKTDMPPLNLKRLKCSIDLRATVNAACQINPTWHEGFSIRGVPVYQSLVRTLRALYLTFALPIYACNAVIFSSVNHKKKSLDERGLLRFIQEQGYCCPSSA